MQSSQESISEANTKIHDLETTMSSVKQSLDSKEEEYNAVVSELAEVKMTVATMRSEEMDNESTLAELRKARGMITDMEARADNVTQELTAHFSQQIEVLTQKLLDSQEAKVRRWLACLSSVSSSALMILNQVDHMTRVCVRRRLGLCGTPPLVSNPINRVVYVCARRPR